ncbi:MAG: chemotaxis-specific protein-glutamate methyltransferase CheB [Oscillospiraceae bacterium]
MQQPNRPIRVMVVDDSMLARSLIIKGLSAQPRIEIVGYAINAMDAKNKIPVLKPDVITMDVEMPGLSGIDFVKQFLPTFPLPIILVSSLDLRVFDALAAGAVDFVRKPDGTQSNEAFITGLAQKIIVASCAKVRTPATAAATAAAKNMPVSVLAELASSTVLDQMIIGLGASTGGTEATLEVMRRLPSNIPAMIVVQHMPTGFTKMYAERLNRLCKMEVREAVNGDELHRGLALVAPADFQARVVRGPTGRYVLSCQPGDKVSGHRPSVDALFLSMAETVRTKMTGIILTGMGRDGASGLLAMRQRGAYTIGQDKASSVVYGMPMVAQDIGAVQIQASCENIAGVLVRHLNAVK